MPDKHKYDPPPYNWIPPAWEPNALAPKLDDTVAKDPKFPDVALACNREPEPGPGQEHLKPGHRKLTKWPHPCSDFTHIDPEDFDENDIKIAKTKLGTAEFEKLAKFVGPESQGMQRLALVFELTLCQVTSLLADINSTLLGRPESKGPDQANYTAARQAYIDFLNDLDNREPEIMGRP